MKLFFPLIFFVCLQAIMAQQPDPLSESIKLGETIYRKKCSACHGKNGMGKGKRIPPLAKSDYLKNNPEESIRGILFGQEGEIVVNGIAYDKKMKAIKLTNQEVADVMNYIINSWGNKSSTTITREKVAELRMTNPKQ
ncbi:cytochrome c [Allomuricauda sp. d1]|uniref:c-type cytochrome n=1 Tax=Allomuricauda sp. d1 TaxID=3136725 RepID=UPI0031D199EB